MKPFEELLRREQYNTESRDNARKKRQADRRLAREERERRRYRAAHITVVTVWAVIIAALLAIPGLVSQSKGVDAIKTAEPAEETTEAVVAPVEEPEEIAEDFENEKIEAALLEMGYFRDDIPLDFETQAYLRAACEEAGVSFELALAVIRRETDYRNIEGDGGDSIGYMQVQPKWHQERMNRLGVTDLSHPLGNFRVGLDYLKELTDKYGIEKGLTAYNSGKPGESEYADTVIRYFSELRGG